MYALIWIVEQLVKQAPHVRISLQVTMTVMSGETSSNIRPQYIDFLVSHEVLLLHTYMTGGWIFPLCIYP